MDRAAHDGPPGEQLAGRRGSPRAAPYLRPQRSVPGPSARVPHAISLPVAGSDAALPYSADRDAPVRQQLQLLSRDVRDEVEQRLRSATRDDVMVKQLATAVMGFG